MQAPDTMKTSPDNPLLADLIAHEKRVWNALVSGDPAADSSLLSDDFLGVYPTGFAQKSEHVAQLASGPTVTSYDITACQAKPLGERHALLSYKARFRRVSRTTDETMYVSSIWERNGDGWINIFSQDTPEADG